MPAGMPEGGVEHSSPVSQRVAREHFVISPELAAKKARIADFWQRPAPQLPEVPPLPNPEFGEDKAPSWALSLIDAVSGLRKDVSDIKHSVVTMDVLKEYHSMAAAETQALVAKSSQETGNQIAEVSAEVVRLGDRLKALELSNKSASFGVSSSAAGPGPDPHDPAARRVAFLGFPEGMPAKQRLALIEEFLTAKFPDVRTSLIDSFYAGKGEGKITRNAFAEFGSRQQARQVANTIRDRGFTLEASGVQIKMKPATSALDLSRNWSLKKAEELIRADPAAQSKEVTVKKGEGRGVFVDKELVFEQRDRYSRGGRFCAPFEHLELP